MSNVPDDLVHEVPAPLNHWYGKAKLSEENQQLLSRVRVLRTLQTAPRWMFWKKNELREAEIAMESLNVSLEVHGINEALALLQDLDEEAKKLRVEMFSVHEEYKRSQQPERCKELRKQGAILRRNMAGVQSDRKKLLERLAPLRKMIQRRDRIAARIQEHYAAITEAKEEAIRTKEMDREVRLIAERIILALNKLGFYHRKTKRDMFGKVIEIKEMCRFERLISTPDKVILKLDVSRLGLLGGYVDNMPFGVYSQDLVDERVIIHLNTALELPISSPNTEGNAEWYKGVWFVVDRLGIPDGLEAKVAYTTVMQRYPEKDRGLIPVPLGVRSGRRINWVYLAKQPHVMVNGTTGFGKSNAFQMLLATLVSKHSPDEIRLIIADMKDSGDFRDFTNLPHVLGFVSELNKAEELITSLWLEMRRRQAIIRQISNDLNKYNEIVSDENKMPHIFFFFDEYPSIKVNPKIAKIINLYASLIAMQGRSAGVHLVVSGQQSYSEDFPRTLSGNITAKLTARQTSVSGAIGTTGDRKAMKLKEIPGRFLFLSTTTPYQIQMPEIKDPDILLAVEQARRWPEPRYFVLPLVETDSEDLPVVAKQSPEELILDTAFGQLEGALKARQIWELLKGALSQPKVNAIVKELGERETIEWDGMLYEPVKEKKYYRLIPLSNTENNEDTSIETEDMTA
jgi:hypothetical protein